MCKRSSIVMRPGVLFGGVSQEEANKDQKGAGLLVSLLCHTVLAVKDECADALAGTASVTQTSSGAM